MSKNLNNLVIIPEALTMINFRESHSQAFFHLLGGLHQK